MGVILVLGIVLGALALGLGLLVEMITRIYNYSPYVSVGFFILLLPVIGFILNSRIKKKISPQHSPGYTILIFVGATILLSLIGTAGLNILGALSEFGFLPLVPYTFVGVVAVYLASSEFTE